MSFQWEVSLPNKCFIVEICEEFQSAVYKCSVNLTQIDYAAGAELTQNALVLQFLLIYWSQPWTSCGNCRSYIGLDGSRHISVIWGCVSHKAFRSEIIAWMSRTKLQEFSYQNRKSWLQEVLITEIMKTRLALIQMSVFNASFSFKLFQGDDGVPGEDGRKVIKHLLLKACVWLHCHFW